jgi:hypothetical protein
LRLRNSLSLILALGGVVSAQRPGPPSPSVDVQTEPTLQDLLTDFTIASPRITAATYGRQMARDYYVVSVSVVNPNSEKVYLQSVTFRRPDKHSVSVAPVGQVARMLEARGASSMLDKSLLMAGVAGAAAVPFIKKSGSRANYAQFLAIFDLLNAFRGYVFEGHESLRLSSTVMRESGVLNRNYVIPGKSGDIVDVFVNKEEVGELLKQDKRASTEQVKQYLGTAVVTGFATESEAQRLVGSRAQ